MAGNLTIVPLLAVGLPLNFEPKGKLDASKIFSKKIQEDVLNKKKTIEVGGIRVSYANEIQGVLVKNGEETLHFRLTAEGNKYFVVEFFIDVCSNKWPTELSKLVEKGLIQKDALKYLGLDRRQIGPNKKERCDNSYSSLNNDFDPDTRSISQVDAANPIQSLLGVNTAQVVPPWWKRYNNTLDYFTGESANVYRRHYPRVKISSLVEAISPGARTPNTDLHRRLAARHFFALPTKLPQDFISTGRYGTSLERDESFYTNARERLHRIDIRHKFFINYTGHQGPVGAALAERYIPVYWQVFTKDRIVNTVQDYRLSFVNNKFSVKESAALMTEPKHQIDQTVLFQTHGLPDAEDLKREGINEVVVFGEDDPKKYISVDTFNCPNQNFRDYLKKLERNGIRITIYGLDSDVA